MPLRPHIVRAGGRIASINACRDGYAVGVENALELYDATLARTRSIPMTVASHVLVLDDGRIVAGGATVHVFGDSGPVEPIALGDFCNGLVPASHGRGFCAIGSDRAVFDREGRRTSVPLTGYVYYGAWTGGVAIANKDGLRLFDDRGEVVASNQEYLTTAPVAVGDVIVVGGLRALHVYDGRGQERGRIEVNVDRLFRFAGGFVAETKRDGEVRFAYFELDPGGRPYERWGYDGGSYPNASVVGAYFVIKSDDVVSIVDGSGKLCGRLDDLAYVNGIVAFDDGIVVCSQRALWWRRRHEVEEFDYEGSLSHARTVPVGFASAEDDILHIWRSDVQGPEPVPLVTDLPMGVPIVVDGSRFVVEGVQRFSLRVRYPNGSTFSQPPQYQAWRYPTTRDEATALRDRLLARAFDGALPSLTDDGSGRELQARLAQLPLAQTVDLVGRGMFALAGLEPEMQRWARRARRAFLDELASALGTSERLLLASLRARKLTVEPPRRVIGYDYLGTFTTSGALTVADPCYLGRKPSGKFSLTLNVEGVDGVWHVFVRPAKSAPDRNAELAVVHDRAFEVHATSELGTIGVDAGCAGVFDRACAKPDLDYGIDEGVVSGLGAVAWSGYGDGGYPVFVGKTAGKVGKIRIVFIDDAPEVDHLVAQPTGPAKPYSASAKFAVGDVIDHPKLGVGSVLRVGGDGKIDVRFADATRTLVHARK